MQTTETIENLKQSHKGDDFEMLKRLHKDEQRQWFVLAGVTVLVTIALAVSVAPMLGEALASLWPWANTSFVLLGGFGLSIMMLVGYLTWQQKNARAIRERVHRMAEKSTRRAKQNTARLHALLNVSRVMGSVTRCESVFETITQTCLETFECQQASLMLVNDEKDTLVMKAATGHVNAAAVKEATMKVGAGIAGWVAETQQPLILNRDTDMSQYPSLKLKDAKLCAAMVVLMGILPAAFLGSVF